MEFTVENVCGLLIRSKLLSSDEVKAMYQRWLAEAKDTPADLGRFSKWLTANRFLTDYQASLITRGHADDFFLGQYKILDRLGQGRMAGVYKGVHQLGQVVAVKVLPPSRAKDAQMLGRFQREARLAMRLKHPNVVRAFQVGEFNNLHYLVMEYLEGETLDEVFQGRRQLPPGEAVRLVHQALLGLQHIHEQGLVHRDVKPSNLMLVPGKVAGQPDTTMQATVKILDIGLGRALFDESSPLPPADGAEHKQLTAEGVLLGTPDYLAPEQARDPRSADIRADIYSLGCVLYHALAGRPPFPDNSIISQMVRHATESPEPLKGLNPAVPDGLQQIVDWMMAKDPAQRYPTPDRAAQALQVFLMAGNAPAEPIDAQPQMRKYLTWLETGNGEDKRTTPLPEAHPVVAIPSARPAKGPATIRPAAAPLTAKLPVAQPVAPPGQTEKMAGPRPAVPVSAHKAKRRKVPLALPKEPALAVRSIDEYDVELVPAVLPAKEAPRASRGWAFNRRDWLFMGVGAGAVIVAGSLGILIRWLSQ
jgi:serine/threonine protein kinase